MSNALSPRILQPGDLDPNWRWDKRLPALGHTAVDFERRVDHDRLRRYRLENPMVIEIGMVFALETYCPATDGYSAARIEEEVVVTDKGCQVISLFAAEELPIANRY